jgi:uncharacterized protein YecA (UPF0149 family)
MLTPAQVLPFLVHDDPLVRRHALTYFQTCEDPAPLVADDVWAAIDRVGGAGEEARSFLRYLHLAPQTDASVRRLAVALAAPPLGAVADLQRTAREVPMPLLLRHHDLLLDSRGLDEASVSYLHRRIALAGHRAEDVWDHLMELGEDLGDGGSKPDDTAEADALIDAAAFHADHVAAPAMAMLVDPEAATDWREIYAIIVLGRIRHAPAVPALVEKLLSHTDAIASSAVHALARIGSADVVDRLAAFIPGKSFDASFNAYLALARIKSPASEAALVRLLQVETDADGMRELVLSVLAELCSLAGLDASRASINELPAAPQSVALAQGLIATAVMCGVALPEEAQWRDRIAAAAAAHDAKVAAAAARASADRQLAFIERHRSGSDASADDDAIIPGVPILPIRNATPKVGRNDPCPCGSGKKHKKCCGAPR